MCEGGLKADSRAKRGFFEQQGHYSTRQQGFAHAFGMLRLQIFADGENAFDFFGGQVKDVH
jgi:hypothetical protein